jgi:hypothetical protein
MHFKLIELELELVQYNPHVKEQHSLRGRGMSAVALNGGNLRRKAP